MTATEQVILVDLNDNPTGIAEKMYAHRHQLRHRAFSVFILRNNAVPEILLQQRAADKYHCPHLWTNTCCSHPRPGEETIQAAQRRLNEEMGIKTELQSLGRFHYIAHFDNGLVENEVDHVLIGFIDKNQAIQPNPTEVQNYRWLTAAQLKKELLQQPSHFTPWLKQAFEKIEDYLAHQGPKA